MTHRPDFRIEPPAPDYVRPDLYGQLERSSFDLPVVRGVEELIADARDNPLLVLICTVGGFAAGMLAVLVPAIVVAGVVR